MPPLIPAKTPLEMAARPPLEAGKSRFPVARPSFSHAKRHHCALAAIAQVRQGGVLGTAPSPALRLLFAAGPDSI